MDRYLSQRKGNMVLLWLLPLFVHCRSLHLVRSANPTTFMPLVTITGVKEQLIEFTPEKISKPILTVSYLLDGPGNAELRHNEFGRLKIGKLPDELDGAMIQAGIRNKGLDREELYIGTQEQLKEDGVGQGVRVYTLSTGCFLRLSQPGIFHQKSSEPDMRQLMVHMGILEDTAVELYCSPYVPIDGNQLVELRGERKGQVGTGTIPPHTIPKWLRKAIYYGTAHYHLLGRGGPPGEADVIVPLPQIQANLMAKLVWKAGGVGGAMRLLHYREEPYGEAEPAPIWSTEIWSQLVIYNEDIEDGNPIEISLYEVDELVAKDASILYGVKLLGLAHHGKWVAYKSQGVSQGGVPIWS